MQIMYGQYSITEEFRGETSISKKRLGRVPKGANILFSFAMLGVGIGYGNLNLNATGSEVCYKTTFRKLPGTIAANLADKLTCLQLQTCLNTNVIIKDLILLAQKGSHAPIEVVIENDNKGISFLRREGWEGSTDVDVK